MSYKLFLSLHLLSDMLLLAIFSSPFCCSSVHVLSCFSVSVTNSQAARWIILFSVAYKIFWKFWITCQHYKIRKFHIKFDFSWNMQDLATLSHLPSWQRVAGADWTVLGLNHKGTSQQFSKNHCVWDNIFCTWCS